MNSPLPLTLKELNPLITCPLCSGYLIDATKLLDCMHTFCRSCIVKHFENSKSCPIKDCLQPCKEKRPDMTLQTLVYKVVPGLYSKEIQRRDDFYRSTDARASSSCSDDSLFGENSNEQEEWIHNLGSKHLFLSPDDSVSLSLEYYQKELDNTPLEKNGKHQNFVVENKCNNSKCDRRYLQCPAAVKMTHLQKFIRMKFGLKDDHKVDIIHSGEVLPTIFTLMDVAYTFKWNRAKPLRFFYRIFSHVKIRPIKIINTSSGGEKHHQIVSVSTGGGGGGGVKEEIKEAKETKEPNEAGKNDGSDQRSVLNSLEEERRDKEKERLMTELKLQVRKKPMAANDAKEDATKRSSSHHHHHHHQENIFRYGEDGNKEKFAENRDREWELLKNPEEEYKISKKRKKNKHSKDEHKKRKLHAEITSEESLKLKVKLTPHNGHKHKHHKSVGFEQGEVVSSKEKINQLRQVRHKSIGNSEEKAVRNEEKGKKNEDTARNDEKAKKAEKIEKPPEANVEKSEKIVQSSKFNSVNPPVKNDKVVNNKKSIQYPPEFTVSRVGVQGGVKRKLDVETDANDLKKPSLEITLITPNQTKINSQGATTNISNANSSHSGVRRPPPAPIPLQKIKNSINFSSGVSIIPKIPERNLDKAEKEKLDTVPLDLSKPHNNGFKSQNADRSANLSNLQMLSKVASEHAQSLNKNLLLNKNPKPQIPNLQSIRLPFNSEKKSMPKLNEINKNDFLQNRILNNSRITRPNQNQCIRNIPNPSLLVRQQNQNRLNCLMQVNNGGGSNNSSVSNNTSGNGKNSASVSVSSNFVTMNSSDNKNLSLKPTNLKEGNKNSSTTAITTTTTTGDNNIKETVTVTTPSISSHVSITGVNTKKRDVDQQKSASSFAGNKITAGKNTGNLEM